MIVLLLGTHMFLTFRLKFPQRKVFKGISLSFKKDRDATGEVSQFASLATALAATIGTGNIIGVATAVSLGGPGAVLWCWLTGVFGIATKYSEGLLAIKYRVITKDGTLMGGPMYAIERGLKMKWLAVLFCVFTVIASFGIGCTVQSNAVSSILFDSFHIPTWLSGLIIAVLVALVILFGVKGISRVCGVLVPFMAVFYVLGCLYIIGSNFDVLGQTFSLILKSAFSREAVGGGLAGGGLMIVMRYGIARGLFSNESGMGSAPIVAAAAQSRNPVRQALVSSTATFWDTVVVCLLTGLVLVSSVIKQPDINFSDGAMLTKLAFSRIPFVGEIFLAIALVTFAFSTILGWSYYAEKCIEYLCGKRIILYFRICYVLMAFVGSIEQISLVWNIADVTNALMAVPNILSLLLLSAVLVKETDKYLWSGRLDDYDPEPIYKFDKRTVNTGRKA